MNSQQDFKSRWHKNYTIRYFEVDVQGAAAVPALCQLMQETAWHHAEHLGAGHTYLKNEGLIWVLSRQLFRFFRYPRLGDSVKVSTWPSGKGRLFWTRDFQVEDRENQLIAISTTVWFTVDFITRKPKPGDFPFASRVEPGKRLFSRKPDKIRALNSPEQDGTFTVGYRDLDLHAHLNNTRYIEWLLEGFPLEFRKEFRLSEMEINYLEEGTYSDSVSTWREQEGEDTFYHAIVRENDRIELCRARTCWSHLSLFPTSPAE